MVSLNHEHSLRTELGPGRGRAIAAAIGLAMLGSTAGQDGLPSTNVAPRDPNLPQAVTDEHFREFLGNSPFIRALNLSDSLMLTGIASFDGKPMATLMDRESKQTYVISEVPNPQGWKLVEISTPGGSGLETVSATVSVGGELVTVRYDERQLKPGEGKPAPGKGEVDKRPPPTDEEKKAFGEMIGKKWKALNKDQQEQAKQIAKEKLEAEPDMSDRQKGELINRILDRVKSDRATGLRRRDGKGDR